MFCFIFSLCFACVTHSISVSLKSTISRKFSNNHINFLYFHINLRLIVKAFLKYYFLTHSGSWDIAIFEMIIFLFLNFSPFCIVSTLSYVSYKLPPCVKKVFDGEKVLSSTESQEHWEASGGKTILIRVDSLNLPSVKQFFLEIKHSICCSINFFRSGASPLHWPHRCRRITIGWSFKIFSHKF